MGENSTQNPVGNPRLTFRTDPGLTSREIADSSTAYVAEAHGVRYRIVGTLAPGARARRFRAYRVAGVASLPKYFPAADGGEHKTRGAARDQAERDLAAVLADRVLRTPETAPAPAVGDLVTFPGSLCQDGDLWRVEQIRPTWRGYFADLLLAYHQGGQSRKIRTSVPLHLLAPAPGIPPAPAIDPATTDTVPELVDRVVRRAQYEALKAALAVLAGWVESAQENNASMGRGTGIGDPVMFDVDEIRRMINDTARELGTALPWRPTDA